MVGKIDFDCSKAVLVTGETLTLEEVVQTAQGRKVQLSEDASERILKAYRTVKEKIDEKKPVYGITTGFGKLSNIAINQGRIRPASEKSHYESCLRRGETIRGRGYPSYHAPSC